MGESHCLRTIYIRNNNCSFLETTKIKVIKKQNAILCISEHYCHENTVNYFKTILRLSIISHHPLMDNVYSKRLKETV